MMRPMWTYHPDLLTRAVPRYTSYPTAAEFTGAVGAEQQQRALDAIPDGTEVSLYVHIPFCSEICWYCGCNTARANRSQRLAAYLEALTDEIETVAARLAGRVKLNRIAFGGGSPNAMSPVDFVRLLAVLLINFRASDPVLSVEIDPRGFDGEWALALGKSGVSRVSLGVQTFDRGVQEKIGRVQPFEMIRDAVNELRRHGVASINFDLMYGLPSQDMSVLDETIDRSIALAPERIALFGYAHVPHMLPRQRRIDATALPDQMQRFAMAAHGHQRLSDAGYMPVGFDHFALPGDALSQAAVSGRLKRNFQGYTEDESEILIGFGASAISSFPQLLVQNEKNSGRYRMLSSSGRLAGTRGVARTADDRVRGQIIETLLCGGRADLSRLPAVERIGIDLDLFLETGLANLEGGCLSITPRGWPYARTIAALFDRYREVQPGRFSTAI